MFPYQQILEHYDRNEFLAAGRLAEPHLRTDIRTDAYDPEELVLLGRLAYRLGGGTLRRFFLRKAHQAAPDHPMVRYFSGQEIGATDLLSLLRDFEAQPVFPGADANQQAVRYASMACGYGMFRDFGKAHELLDLADELSESEQLWLLTCRSDVLINQDRWSEALDIARRAWTLNPGFPSAATHLARAQIKLQGVSGLVDQLLDIPDERRSWEIYRQALWYSLVEAERQTGSRRLSLLERSQGIAAELKNLMPLADRAMRRTDAAIRVDYAMLAQDYQQLFDLLPTIKHPFFQSIQQALQGKQQAGMLQFQSAHFTVYQPVYQKYFTCLPSSINAVSAAFGTPIDHDIIARDITFDGTSTWRARDWLKEHGWVTRYFKIDQALCLSLLDRGVPFLFFREYHTSAHAMAVVGYHPVYGTLYIHDPSQERLVEILIDQLSPDETPVGPLGMVLLPADRSKDLDLVPLENWELPEFSLDYFKTLETQGSKAAGVLLDGAIDRWGGCPELLRLQANLAGREEPHRAISILSGLLVDYPDCTVFQRELMLTWHSTRDTAAITDRLAKLVEEGRYTEKSSVRLDNVVPAGFVAQYIDYLGNHHAGFVKAEHLFRKTIQNAPLEASLYHVWGDVLSRHDRRIEAELPLRLATRILDTNHHYARAYADLLAMMGQPEKASAFMLARLARLKDRLEGPQIFLQVADAFEDWGLASQARKIVEQAVQQYLDIPELLHWVSLYYLRNGAWDLAGPLIQRLQESGNRPAWLEAAGQYHLKAGDWRQALDLAETWMAECPDDLGAARTLMRLLPYRDGNQGMVSRLKALSDSHPANDDFGELYLSALDVIFDPERRETFLRQRLDHNPLDSWAWAELGQLLIANCENDLGAGSAGYAEVRSVIERLVSLNSNQATTLGLQARACLLEQRIEAAIEFLFEANRTAPNWIVPYKYLLESRTRMVAAERGPLLMRIRLALLASPGQLSVLPDLIEQLAESDGYQATRDFLESCAQERPQDPRVLESCIKLELDNGAGVEGFEQALDWAQQGITRFPAHIVFEVQRIQALLNLRQDEAVQKLLLDLLQREPTNLWAQRMLSTTLERLDQSDAAITVLRDAISKTPIDTELWSELIALLLRERRFVEMESAMVEALAKLPDNIELRRRIINLYQEMGNHPAAVHTARQGTEIFPDGAYLWYLYGLAMHNSPHHNNLALIVEAYQTALSYNRQLFPAADMLAVILSVQRKYQEAAAVLEEQISLNPSMKANAQGRQAWIKRVSGEKLESVRLLEILVRDRPEYGWGWDLLLAWLEEDQRWDDLQRLLQVLPAVFENDPKKATERLRLLAAVGLSWSVLCQDWEALAHRYPGHAGIANDFFELLLKNGEIERASQLLDDNKGLHAESAWFLVNQASLAVRRSKEDEAAADLVQIAFTVLEGAYFPSEAMQELLKQESLALLWVTLMVEAIRYRPCLNSSAVELACNYFHLLRNPGGEKLDPTGRSELIVDLMEKRDSLSPEIDDVKAALFYELTYLSESAARLYVRNHYPECREHPVFWGNFSRMCVSTQVSTEVRDDWFKDWEHRVGVRAWHITNYLYGMRLKRYSHLNQKSLHKIGRHAQSALNNLPPDHTTGYIASVAIECLIRTGQFAKALDIMSQWSGYLETCNESHWFPDGYRSVAVWIPKLYGLATCPESGIAVGIWNLLLHPPILAHNWQLGSIFRLLTWRKPAFGLWVLPAVGTGLLWFLRGTIRFIFNTKNS